MTAPKDLNAEHARIAAEFEAATVELAVAEEQARGELNKVAGALALGEITNEQARERRAAIQGDLEAKREHVALLRDAIPELELRALEEARTAKQRELQVIEKELVASLTARYSASKALSRELRGVINAALELGRHRQLVQEQLDRYTAALNGDHFAWPGTRVDEEWSIPEEVVDILARGAVAPIAAAAEEAQRTRSLQDDEVLAWFARSPTAAHRRSLPTHLRDDPRVAEAEAAWDENVREQREARANRERERAGVRA